MWRRFSQGNTSASVNDLIKGYEMKSSIKAIICILALVTVVVIAMFAYGFIETGNSQLPKTREVHLFQMSASDVETYGLYYPVTFIFTIPTGSTSLKAWYSYDSTNWSELFQRQSEEFFNGEDCVRFDYTQVKAYVSIGFKGHTSLYIKITDNQNLAIETTYLQVAKYYDNRHCAVTSHNDDYGLGGGAHLALIEEFQKRKLWYGCAVITAFASWNDWNSLQTQVNEGYVEVQSHFVNHSFYSTLSDSQVWGEIQGSRDAILGNITNMPYGQYVSVLLVPNIGITDRERSYTGKAGYLVIKDDGETTNQYSDWYTATYKGEVHGIFPSMFTTTMGSWFVDQSDDDRDGIINGMDENYLNKKFDEVYNSGGIYELRSHPGYVNVSESYCQNHLNYISGQKDCWYVPVGQIYCYHYVALFVQHSSVTKKNFA